MFDADLFNVRDWGQLLIRDDVLILDTETSGLNASAEVLELEIIDTRGRELLHRYVLPEGSISRESTNVLGLDRKLLKQLEAEPWPHIHDEVCGMLNSAGAVVIYNAEFDIRVLCQTADMHGLAIWDFDCHCAMLAYANYRNEIHPYYNNPRWHKLAAAAKHENIAFKQDHHALSDCHMVLALMRAVASTSK